MSAVAGNSLRVAGLVLAAGRSRRMGTLKHTLPWPRPSEAPSEPSTIVASAFDAIAPYCERMFIVVGRDAEAVMAALDGRSFTRIDADSDDEMLGSVRAGMGAIIDATMSTSQFDAMLLQPGDHPGVARRTIEALFDALRIDPERAVLPEYAGKGGHPALIPADVAQSIVDWKARRSGGLRQFWMNHLGLRQRIAVDDVLCTLDLDTPADYQAALAALRSGSLDF